MKKHTIGFLFFLLLCISVMPSQADDLIIAVDEANPPFMYNDGGKAAGLYPVLLTAIFNKMGVPAKIEAYPWKRALDMGKKGGVGIGGIYKNDERLKIFDYSEALFSEKLVLFINKEKQFNFTSVQDLAGKKVGIILGWSYGEDFDTALKNKTFSVDEAKSDISNLKKVSIGWLDCAVAIELAGQKIMAEEKLEDTVIISQTPVAINDTYLVFAKSQNKTPLIKQFNTTLTGMKKDGSFDRIVGSFVSGK